MGGRVAAGHSKLDVGFGQPLAPPARVQTAATFGLVVLGPILALVTYLVMGPLDQGASSNFCASCCWPT
jgi:hypothetical protein